MYAVYFVFLAIWLAYVWTWKGSASRSVVSVRTHAAPTFRQNCSVREVPCIDDCSFLCVDPDAKCIGGVCRPETKQPVACNASTGGVLMLSKNPVPEWTCICTDSRFFRGRDCATLNPDVCEHGMFLYQDRRNYECVCPPPYVLIEMDTKPHCVEKKMKNF